MICNWQRTQVQKIKYICSCYTFLTCIHISTDWQSLINCRYHQLSSTQSSPKQFAWQSLYFFATSFLPTSLSPLLPLCSSLLFSATSMHILQQLNLHFAVGFPLKCHASSWATSVASRCPSSFSSQFFSFLIALPLPLSLFSSLSVVCHELLLRKKNSIRMNELCRPTVSTCPHADPGNPSKVNQH